MKAFSTVLLLLCLCFVLAAESVVKKFEDTGEALLNPSMGWMAFFYTGDCNLYPGYETTETFRDFEGISTVYMRLDWSLIQRAEEFIDWSVIDTVAQRYIAEGKKVGLRFIAANTNGRATPAWVYKAGAKSVTCEFRGNKFQDPVFDDPIFLEKLENFLAAAGKRFDNSPDIAFVDIGTFGMWGEGHTEFSQKLSQAETDRLVLIHAKLHRRHFPNTLLSISDDVIGSQTKGSDFPLMKQLREELNVTFRDDSILVGRTPWFHEELAQHYWRALPVILEHQHLGAAIKGGVWSNDKLLQAVEAHHASYLSVHGWPDEEKKVLGEYLGKINRRLGYRIQLRQIAYPAVVKPGAMIKTQITLANAGVAPCYPGGFMTLTLKDESGGIASVLVDESFDVKELAVGPADKIPEHKRNASFRINPNGPVLKAGVYDLFFSVGNRMGTPTLALPLAGGDGDRRYKVGQITVDTDFLGMYRGKAVQIWDKLTSAAGCETYLTRSFRLEQLPKEAVILGSADDIGTLYVNGTKLERPLDGWANMKRYEVTQLLKEGDNLIAIHGKNVYAACGVLAELSLDGKPYLVSDDTWRSSATPVEGWESNSAVSQAWTSAVIVGRDFRNIRTIR